MSRYDYYERYEHRGSGHHGYGHRGYGGDVEEFVLWNRYMWGYQYPHRHRYHTRYSNYWRDRDGWADRYDPYRDFPYIGRYR